jgi:hypothetical protein
MVARMLIEYYYALDLTPPCRGKKDGHPSFIQTPFAPTVPSIAYYSPSLPQQSLLPVTIVRPLP